MAVGPGVIRGGKVGRRGSRVGVGGRELVGVPATVGDAAGAVGPAAGAPQATSTLMVSRVTIIRCIGNRFFVN